MLGVVQSREVEIGVEELWEVGELTVLDDGLVVLDRLWVEKSRSAISYRIPYIIN